jgi:hypothetical protein
MTFAVYLSWYMDGFSATAHISFSLSTLSPDPVLLSYRTSFAASVSFFVPRLSHCVSDLVVSRIGIDLNLPESISTISPYACF